MSHATRSWYSIRATAADSAPAEVSIHDEIGAWGVSAKQFLADLASIPAARSIALSLHSPGGEVFDGLAIYNALKSRGNVDVTIAGLAASMASVIAMAGRNVTMPRNAYLMIHNPSGMAFGDSADMRELADLLDKLKGSLVSAYTERTGLDPEEIEHMMDSETWLTGEEAAAKGFVDRVSDTLALAASASFGTRFAHAPRALFDTPSPVMDPQDSTPAAADETPALEEVAVTTDETPAAAEPAEEAAAAAEEPAPEASMTDAALAVAAAGVLKKARATRAQVEALTAERDAALAKISELEAANTKLQTSVELVNQLRAEIAKLEADEKTLSTRAAEIAASHGLRPDALAALPAPMGEAPSLLEQFNALSGEDKRAFYLKNEEQLKRELYKK